MRRSKLIGLILGTSLVFSGLAGSANAQTNNSNTSGSNLSNITGSNLSNITGTNVFDGAPMFFNTGGLNPQLIESGEQLADQLTDAYVACNSCGCSDNTCELRGFLLGQGPAKPAPTQTSYNPEKCEKLNSLLRESDALLEKVDQQVETIKASVANRTW
ncbi:hypothetical protein NIES267_26340 [Calothrix parasitica NIES-267]|uniref:Secreted protein n=1 Tax=Calothrix parasitica NIES-267 TaxID=1973488 RepID=A0A1Z4LPL5_9CYAN|nr:hypothetical protein NIES267_26340 [Calothrix parasitica NIES-267]